MYEKITFVDNSMPPINAAFLNGIQDEVISIEEGGVARASSTTGDGTVYTTTIDLWEAKPTSAQQPVPFIFVPNATNKANAKIIINGWNSAETDPTLQGGYPICDTTWVSSPTSSSEGIKANMLHVNVPYLMFFRNNQVWVDGGYRYVRRSAGAGTGGYFNFTTTAPTQSTRINYEGYLYATRLYGAYYNDSSSDIAEGYSVEGEVEAGDLISITKDGKYIKNVTKDNIRHIGIVSDSYAAFYGTDYGSTPIALAGRVKAKVIGKCDAGDILAASDTPGCLYAAPVDSPDSIIIGKALEQKTDSGIARILVLAK